MRTVAAPAALAQSRVGLNDAVRRMRELMRLVGLAGWLLVFVVLVLCWQIALLLALFGGFIHLVSYVGIHVVGCAVLAAWPIFRLNRAVVDERNLTALQIVIWSALAGPFGAFSAIALTFPTTAHVASSAPRDGDAEARTTDRSTIERVERAHIALLDHRVRLEGASRIRPLMDVIAEGSRTERLEALRVVYRKYDARLGPVLKRALYDPDASVRVLAATVMAKLHGTYTRVIGDRQTEAAANPNLEQNWLTLAEARLAYAQSGLLESLRARAQIEHAIGDLSRAVQLDPTSRASATLLDSARRQLTARER
jgi:hypothetical protein